MKEYIDASVFLGTQSSDEKTRIRCKNFFVKRLKAGMTVIMNLEQVGRCDDVIWEFSREEQDAYYPYMDNLHSLMNMQRISYEDSDIKIAKKLKLKKLNLKEKLAVNMAIARGGKLYTVNPRLLIHKDLPVSSPTYSKELFFPSALEKHYQASLKLRINVKGIVPPLVTPVDNNGNVSEQSVKRLIEHVAPYSGALMPTLSSGEGWALSEKQFSDMVKFTVKYSPALPVFAGVEYKTTNEVVQKAKLAKKLGADAIVITTPFKKNISQEEIYQHFKRIKEKVKIPIFIYNEEAISGNSINYETILKICRLGNIVGIKEASGSAKFTQKLINAKIKVPIFQGWEHLCFESKGAEGYILPLCNLEPEFCLNMLRDSTLEKQNKMNSLCKRYNISGDDWYVYLKKELHKRKVITTDKVI